MDTSLKINGTEDTPEVNFDAPTNQFVISGRSLPEDVTSFYKPVFEWLDAASGSLNPGAVFKFKLEYFNTASSKIILDILMKLEEMADTGLKVEWHYNEADEDMLEAGEEYKELVEIPFEFVAG